MCEVAWCNFSWEAFATLVAGGLAVFGATIVGLRQQKILNHHSTIERLKLRSDTFEQRWAIYKTTADWLLHWWQSGEPATGDKESEYVWAIERAKFLFRPEVSEQLDRWLKMGLQLRYAERQAERATGEAAKELENKIVETANSLEKAFKQLPILFGEDMRMNESEGRLPPFVSGERGGSES